MVKPCVTSEFISSSDNFTVLFSSKKNRVEFSCSQDHRRQFHVDFYGPKLQNTGTLLSISTKRKLPTRNYTGLFDQETIPSVFVFMLHPFVLLDL